MADIVKELSLNYSPKSYKNNSLFYAENVKLSPDCTVLENENNLVLHNTINSFLQSYLSIYKIIHILPCNNELLIFVSNKISYFETNEQIIILRYNEKNNKIAIVYGEHYGSISSNAYKGISVTANKNISISSDFTYNVDNSLILSFCLSYSDKSKDEPLSTINLGTFDNGYIDSYGIWIDKSEIYNDRHLSYEKLYNIPEVLLPQIDNLEYDTGKAYVGYYYLFIRYKINRYDYTQWYNIGPNYFIVDLKYTNLISVKGNAYSSGTGTVNPFGFNSYSIGTEDIIGKSFHFDINNLDDRYDKYQLGFIIINKTLNKNLITGDININHNAENHYIFDLYSCLEDSIDINVYENIYNVKNIVNKQNKLYVANYDVRKKLNYDTSNIKIRGSINSKQILTDKIKFEGTDLTYDGDITNIKNLFTFLMNYCDRSKITEEVWIEFFYPQMTKNANDEQFLCNVAGTYPSYSHTLPGGAFARPALSTNGASGFNYCLRQKMVSDVEGWSGGNMRKVNIFDTSINIQTDMSYKLYFYNGSRGQGITFSPKKLVAFSYTYLGTTKSNIFTDCYTSEKIDAFGTRQIHWANTDINSPGVNEVGFSFDVSKFRTLGESEADLVLANKFATCVRIWNSNKEELLTIYNHCFGAETKYSYDFSDSWYTENGAVVVSKKYDINNPGDSQDVTPYTLGTKVETYLSSNYNFTENYKFIENLKNYNSLINIIHSSLIPGELYDFYIHFVDKYGIATDGYRLDCETNFIQKYKNVAGSSIQDANISVTKNDIEYRFVSFIDQTNWNPPGTWIDNVIPTPGCFVQGTMMGQNYYRYLFMPHNSNILKWSEENNAYILNYDNGIVIGLQHENEITFLYYSKEDIENYGLSSLLSNFVNLQSADYIGETFDLLHGDLVAPNKDIKWYQVAHLQNIGYLYPNTSFVSYPNLYGHNLFKVPISNPCSQYSIGLYVENVDIPEGYVGWFISYKKFDNIIKCVGIGNQNGIITDTVNIDKENYASTLLLKLCKVTLSFIQTNVIELYTPSTIDSYRNIYSHELQFAGESVKSRLGKHSIYKLNDPLAYPNIFNNPETDCWLMIAIDTNINKYTNEDAPLFRIGNIYRTTDAEITTGFNGALGYSSVIQYNETHGVAYRNATPHKLAIDLSASTALVQDSWSTSSVIVNLIKLWSNKIFSSTIINNHPEVQYHNEVLDNLEKIITDTTRENKADINQFVQPQNSIDLFDRKLQDFDEGNPYFYRAFRKDIIYKDSFNKTLKISNIISDESRKNNWRNFSTEEYKYITENKGNIVKLIDLGTWLFVHTEHSLFGFDTDNWMKTQDKNVNLQQQEIINIQYKEFFSEKLGFGGLADIYNSIKGTFGYIWWDKDHNKIYRVDNNSFADISEDIQYWLNKIKPNDVFFLNDVKNDRLLILIEKFHEEKIISYNYKTNNWISFHTEYHYDKKSVNTKEITYFLSKENNKDIFKNIKEDNIDDKKFDKKPCIISIICNENYESYKYLEWIEYKFKRLDKTFIIDSDYYKATGYIYELLKPYAGEILYINNDELRYEPGGNKTKFNLEITGDKNQKDNFTKPYYKLGDWRFNCLRNANMENGYVGKADDDCRIYGNYFIFRFEFNSKELINIESFKASMSQFENI